MRILRHAKDERVGVSALFSTSALNREFVAQFTSVVAAALWFDKLTTNGGRPTNRGQADPPFGLSLSKAREVIA